MLPLCRMPLPFASSRRLDPQPPHGSFPMERHRPLPQMECPFVDVLRRDLVRKVYNSECGVGREYRALHLANVRIL